MSRHARIEIAPASGHGYFLRLRASNGRTLAHSEVYASRSNAKRAVEAWLVGMYDLVHSPDVREVDQ